MNESDRKEFLELLGDMYGAYNRNLKANIAGGVWKGLKHMTLSEFRAVVEASIESLQHASGGVAVVPDVPQMWERHRELKGGANPGTRSTSEPNYHGDHWSVAGNLLLMRHVVRLDKPAGLDYAPDERMVGQSSVSLRTGEHTAAIAKILTRWMNAWVIDVREAEVDGREHDRRKAWIDCMAEADRQVSEYLARYVREAEAA